MGDIHPIRGQSVIICQNQSNFTPHFRNSTMPLEKYLEYVYPEPKDRLSTESEAECIARDRCWSECFHDPPR